MCSELRSFLSRNQISFDWLTPDASDLPTRWPGNRPSNEDCPVLRLADGTIVSRPTARQLAELLGLQTSAHLPEYDTVIVGGGPAGLAAAVYGASEGLRTVVVECQAPGGQAGTSSRIENYLGFPSGVSGDELASRALRQARRLGAEILVTRSVKRIDPASREVFLDGGEAVRARTVILATGVTWRQLAIEGVDRLIGKGIYYGAARSEAGSASGLDVHLIGAGNSAGQAALHFANHARTVTLIVRGDSLEKSMSRYLIDQLRKKSNIAVQVRSEVRGAWRHALNRDRHPRQGKGHGTPARLRRSFCLHWSRRGNAMAAGRDRARCARLCLDRRRSREGRALVAEPRSLPARNERAGHFRLWGCRLSPVKRVASAVGEGSMAIAFVHQYLQEAAQ